MEFDYHLDLFSGIGGFALATQMAGLTFKQRFNSDINEFTNQIYKKNFPKSISLGDVRKIEPETLPKGEYLITAGFPCQPFSIAGKQLGNRDKRNLWGEVVRLVSAIKPSWVVCENVPNLENIPFKVGKPEVGSIEYQKGIDEIQTLQLFQCCEDLKAEGYEVTVFEIPAIAKNAPHKRSRLWIVANFDFRQGDSRYVGVANKATQLERQSGLVNHSNTNRTFSAQNAVSARRKVNRVFFSNFANNSSTRLPVSRQSRIGQLSTEKTERMDNRFKLSNWHEWFEVATAFCGMDDGLSSGLDIAGLRNDLAKLYPKATEKDIERAIKLTISEYRRKRIESLGNSIVPQVAMEIFRVIKMI